MATFKLKETPVEEFHPIEVTLEQEGKDVNILIDGQLCAWFASEGEMYIATLPKSLREKLRKKGVVLTEDGRIMTYPFSAWQ
jgi:hypothetical protein